MQTPTELTITTERKNGDAVISVGGRVTIDTSPDLRKRLLAILEDERFDRLTINLTNVPYIDCSGLATLVEALRLARGRSLEVELSGLHDRVLYLLQVTGLLRLFQQLGHERIRSGEETE